MGLERVHPTIAATWPAPLRFILFGPVAWLSVSFLCSLYYLTPVAVLLLPCALWWKPWGTGALLLFAASTLLLPMRPWPPARRLGQIYYDIFNLRTIYADLVASGHHLLPPDQHRYILCQFPHGVVPFTVFHWCSLVDQLFPYCYGFGAISPWIKYIPVFRNLYGWLSGGSPSYSVITKELRSRNLYVLPDGIAGIFVTAPGKHRIVFKDRRGLIRLALEHGATLVPVYTFGMSDAFDTFPRDDEAGGGWFSRFCRRNRMAIVLFWGQFGLPIPRRVSISFVFGEGVTAPKLAPHTKASEAIIDALHADFCENLRVAFDKYKAEAGYPDAQLEII